jgi:hypothetical protein
MLKNLDLKLLGTTVHFKFTAFNAYVSGEQDLSAVTDYTYTVTGYAQTLGKIASIETGATAGDNLVTNSAINPDTSSWLLTSGVSRVAGTSSDPGNYFQFAANALWEAKANVGSKRPLAAPGGKLYWSTTTFNNTITSGTHSLIFEWFKADGAASSTASTTVSCLATAGAGWQAQQGSLTAPADATQFAVKISANVVGNVVNSSALRVSLTDPAADKTSANTAAAIAGQGALATLNSADTQQITINAVTNSISAFSSSNVSLLSISYATLQTVTITASAGDIVDIIANFAAEFAGGSNTVIYVRVSRGATILFTTSAWTPQYVGTAFSDTPGAGTFTYTLSAACAGVGVTVNCTNRYLRALLTKR